MIYALEVTLQMETNHNTKWGRATTLRAATKEVLLERLSLLLAEWERQASADEPKRYRLPPRRR